MQGDWWHFEIEHIKLQETDGAFHMYKATTGYSKRPKVTFWKTLNYYAKKIICAWYGNISTEQLIKLLKSLHIFVVIGSVRFLVLTLIPLKIQAFLYVMPCQLTDIYGHNDITFMAHNAFITRNKQSKDSVLMASILTVSKWGTTLMSTCYGLKGPGIKCQWGRDFLQQSWLALEPTQPPVQEVQGLFPRGKAAWVRHWTTTHLAPILNKS